MSHSGALNPPPTNPRPRVFVSVAKVLPPGLVWQLLNALQAVGTEPFVYHGVPRPVGDIVTNAFVEARSELVASDVLVSVLAIDATSNISADWSLAFHKQVLQHSVPVLVYLVPRSDVGPDHDALANLGRDVTITALTDHVDITDAIVHDVRGLFDRPIVD